MSSAAPVLKASSPPPMVAQSVNHAAWAPLRIPPQPQIARLAIPVDTAMVMHQHAVRRVVKVPSSHCLGSRLAFSAHWASQLRKKGCGNARRAPTAR